MKFTVGKVKLPRLYLGTSPFIGAGQFGEKAYFYREFWLKNPDNLIRIFEMAGEQSIGVQAISHPAIIEAAKETGVECVVSAGIRDFEREIDEIGEIECRAVLLHASKVDSWVKDKIEKSVEIAVEMGYIGGAATHNPSRTLPELMASDIMDIFLVPINKAGMFMGEKEMVIDLVERARNLGKKIIAMKPLAAGRLKLPDIDFAMKHADGIAVGIGTFREFEETFGYLKRRFGR